MWDKADKARYNAERRAAKKAKGICQNCPEAAVTGQTRCTACVAGAARRHRERKAKGICQNCPEAAVTGKTRCVTHSGRDEARVADRRRGDPVAAARVRSRFSRLRQARNAAGLCASCGKEPKRSTAAIGDACAAKEAAWKRLRGAARREVGLNSRGKPLKGAPF